MTWLSLILVFKIIVSFVFLILPFLFLPKEKLEIMTSTQADTSQLYRLYGVAVLALVVAYGFGISPAEAGVFPWGVVTMGIFSNMGASACMISYGVSKKNRFPIILFGFIGLALTAAALAPELALNKI